MRTTEYIKREYAVDAVADVYYNTPDINLSCEKFEAAILKIPSSDVAPVKHGRWEPILEGVWNLPTPVLVGWCCSQCGRTEQEKEPYCNCGVKMDEEVDHD